MCVWVIKAIHITATFSLICGKDITEKELFMPRVHVTLVTWTRGYSVNFCVRYSCVTILCVPNKTPVKGVFVYFI